jgi:hypothetical protein
MVASKPGKRICQGLSFFVFIFLNFGAGLHPYPPKVGNGKIYNFKSKKKKNSFLKKNNYSVLSM